MPFRLEKIRSGGIRLGIAVFALLALAGCATTTNNNARTLDNLVDHFTHAGIPIQSRQPLLPEPFNASEAVALKIGDSEIGAYKYNKDNDLQRKRVEKIEQEKCIYFQGFKYSAMVRGSFMIIGFDKNTRKKEIIQAFESF
jgi:hypothetical protein